MEHFESKLSCSDLKDEIQKLLISIPKNLHPPKSFPKHITNNYLEKKRHAHTLHLCIIALERVGERKEKFNVTDFKASMKKIEEYFPSNQSKSTLASAYSQEEIEDHHLPVGILRVTNTTRVGEKTYKYEVGFESKAWSIIPQ